VFKWAFLIGAVATMAVVSTFPLLAYLVGGATAAAVAGAVCVIGGFLWTRKPISHDYRRALVRLHERGEVDRPAQEQEAHILRTRRVVGYAAVVSGAAALGLVLATL
jgi:hypothetical protein